MGRLVCLLVTVTLAVCGCTPTQTSTPVSMPVHPASAATVGPVPAAGTCHINQHNNQPLPDRTCTPGTTNPDVTPDTIHTTICKSGWTKTVRPAVSVTTKLKKQIRQEYSIDDPGELDHLISLELGGAPSDPRNLWVEAGPIPNPKDKVENQLNSAVCGGLITLNTAQQAIASDWTTAIDSVGLTTISGKVCLQGHPARCATGRGGTGE